MNAKELQEKLVEIMKRWQRIEDATAAQTARAIEQTDNPSLRTVMEVIQRDSQTHRRVQQMIIDSFEKEAVHISPEEIAKLSETVAKHVEVERESIQLAQEALEALRNSKLHAQKYLIQYLLTDEEKHERLLTDLDLIKRGMQPYGGF